MNRSFQARSRRNAVVGLLPLLLLAGASGCGPGEGTVSGRVLHDGKPVHGGWLRFVPTERGRNGSTARIDENGSYQITVTAGEVQISVDNREWQPQTREGQTGLPPQLPPGVKLPPTDRKPVPAQAPAPRYPGKYDPIPERFYGVETSGLRYTVTSGAQTHDIELK